jgi:Lon protease-like protein
MHEPSPDLPAEIPLFPLNTVLFPGGPLPLRIFEARYIDLVRRCLREQSGFGVVLISEGAEAGNAPTETCDVGTYARIVDFSSHPDGLLGIEARGERRFRIRARRRERDGLHMAEIDWLPLEVEAALPEEFFDLGPALDYVMTRVGEPYLSLQRKFDDAGWVAGRLAEILPLPTVHKQQCLEIDDPVERLRFLRPLFEITTEPPDGEDDDDGSQAEDDEDPERPDDAADADDDDGPETGS